ncbi:MAG: hypothetical protein ACRDY0_12665, partial [Acidimicrobiales bacterium]
GAPGLPAPVRPAPTTAPTTAAPAPPYAALGLLWALLLLCALVEGPAWLAVLTSPVAFVATASAFRAAAASARAGAHLVRRRASPTPARLAVSCLVAAVAFAAVGGPAVAIGAGGLAAAAAAALSPYLGLPPWRAALAAGAPSAACASVVLARHQGLAVTVVLVAACCLFDAGSTLMGRWPGGGVLGTAAGLATVAVLGFLVAALANPPFRGLTPWAMVVGAGVLSASGIRLCQRLVGGGRVPALGRLDSLVLAGPLWVVMVGLVLHK